MTTQNKDFKVKHGLSVANGATFGDAISIGAPTESYHAATKAYVDSLDASIPVTATAPASPVNGDLWFDTFVERLKVYYGTQWLTIATSNDLQNIPDHIHNTAIDGDGRIVTIFWDGQWYNSPQLQSLDGGEPGSTTWEYVFDGGSAVDNFN